MKKEVEKKRIDGRSGKKRDKGIRKRMKRIEAKYKNTTVPPWKERNEG